MCDEALTKRLIRPMSLSYETLIINFEVEKLFLIIMINCHVQNYFRINTP